MYAVLVHLYAMKFVSCVNINNYSGDMSNRPIERSSLSINPSDI